MGDRKSLTLPERIDAEGRFAGLEVDAAGNFVLDDSDGSYAFPWTPEGRALRAEHEAELRAKYGDNAFDEAQAAIDAVCKVFAEDLEANPKKKPG